VLVPRLRGPLADLSVAVGERENHAAHAYGLERLAARRGRESPRAERDFAEPGWRLERKVVRAGERDIAHVANNVDDVGQAEITAHRAVGMMSLEHLEVGDAAFAFDRDLAALRLFPESLDGSA